MFLVFVGHRCPTYDCAGMTAFLVFQAALVNNIKAA